MPDARLDAITDAIDGLQTDWLALVVAAKSAAQPRDTVDLLDAGVITIQSSLSAINADVQRLPTKDIAIDLHTAAT